MAVVRRGSGKTAPTADAYLPEDAEDQDVLTDDDEDTTSSRSSSLQAGWGAAKRAIKEGGKGFIPEFKFTESPQLVFFRNAGEPIASYKQHWLEKAGRKSYACLDSIGEKCPLCSILGHQPDTKIVFSIARIGDDAEDITAEILTVGPRLAGMLESLHEDRREGPLDKKFWNLKRTGKASKTQHFVQGVKASDLAEDYDLDPAEVQAKIADLRPVDASVIRFDTVEELTEVARDLAA